MGQSFRARRLERRAQNQRKAVGLNLVSLMDIFTILVFFLLVNASDVEVLPTPRGMELPESTAEERAREVPVIMITREEILLQHGDQMRVIITLAELAQQQDNGSGITALQSALQERVALMPIDESVPDTLSRGEINIMADKDTPYATLRRVMRTAGGARFDSIALTVLQQVPDDGEGAT